MRPIEFKVVDKTNKRMYDVRGVVDQFVYVKQNDFDVTYIELKNSILLQYTGKKNKHGVKLYDGDYNCEGQAITWCDNCIGWQMSSVDVPSKEIVINCHWCDGNFHINEEIEDYEPIGNVYQL